MATRRNTTRSGVCILALGLVAGACFAPRDDPDGGGGLLGGGDAAVGPVTTVVATSCESRALGLTFRSVPDGWQCREIDPGGGGSGFVLYRPDAAGGLEYSVGAPDDEPTPCEAFEVCDDVELVDLGPGFAMTTFEVVGVTIIFGTHLPSGVDVGITASRELTDVDLDEIRGVLGELAAL